MSKLPSVTIITPTTNDRAAFNVQCANYANKQNYPNIVEHLWDFSEYPIGTKRNELCKQAQGDIIVHMDSDDIYAADWVSKSVSHLLESKADITGLRSAYFFNTFSGKIYDYKSKMTQGYAMGATMCYYKRIWEKKPFEDIYQGEDLYFLDSCYVNSHNHKEGFIAQIHSSNVTGNKKTGGKSYTPVEKEERQRIKRLFKL